MSKIFISYSSLDSTQAVEFYGALLRLAHEVWMDRAELKGGQEWLQVIQQQIRWADTMLVVWSANALNSVWVQTELQYAHALGKKIIPVRIDDTSALEHMIVNARQMVDARQHSVKAVIDEIQASIESDHQAGSIYHQVPLPAKKSKDRFPVTWMAGIGIVVLLVLAGMLAMGIINLINTPLTPTLTVMPTTAPTITTASAVQPTIVTAQLDLSQPATVDLLNTWRTDAGLTTLVENDQLQQVAMDHVSYLRSLPLSELEQTNIFRTADGQDAQFMAQEAGYSGTVQMVVVVTGDTVTLEDVLTALDDQARFSEIGFREVRSFSTGNQYFVMILGAPA